MNDLTADLARALFRAERAERELGYLLRVISRLEGHNDDDLARLRHLPPEGEP